MSRTVREILQELQNEVANNPGLTPGRASEILNRVSALMGNITEEIVRTDVEYRQILANWYETEEKANRAKIKAESSPQYADMLRAKATSRSADELIKSLKYYLKAQEREWRAAGNL